MPKYYVESGPVQLVLDAADAREAAVKAFQWSCDRQTAIDANSPLAHVQEAERRGWQLGDEIRASEEGFGRNDGVAFDTLEIVAAWQGYAFPWG